MSNLCIFWVIATCCVFGVACDDEASKTDRVPQINLNGGEDNSQAGEEDSLEICERTFMFTARGTTPNQVKLAGSFENPPWSGSISLSDENNDGSWLATVMLSEGEHEYKYIVDDEWQADLDQAQFVDDGAGGLNSLIVHSCPFEAECLQDQDCEESKLCRGTRCVNDDQPALCERCPEDCDPQSAECIEALPPECDDATPCTEPFVCEAGRCVPECQTNEDCAEVDPTALCVDLSCVIPECEEDNECDPLEESCLSFQCMPRPCSEVLFIFDPQGEVYDSVHIAGDFNANANREWPASIEAGGWAMTRLDDGRYFGRYIVDNGVYAYKFVLTRNGDTEWISDPQASAFADDGFGGQNSLLEQNCENTTGQGQCGDLEEFRWEDAVMYFAMVDRFYDSDSTSDPVSNATGGNARTGPSGQYEGGDINGVNERLEYLKNLGVNALWLSAPYENRNSAGAAIDPSQDPNMYSAYHGYWPSPENIDYSDLNNPSPKPKVESRIGTEADLKNLIDNAHDQGMKVLFDYVMNHVDIDSGLYQAHPDWFARRENGAFALCGPENLWEDSYWGTRCSFTDYLPPFDFEQAEPRAWSINDALWWAKEFNIDGYRLDAIKHVPFQWLLDLRQALNETFTNPAGGRFYLVGETFAYDDPELIRDYINPETMLDGQFDFPYKARLCEALFRPEGRLDRFANWMNGNDRFYGPGSLNVEWLGNHDIPRQIHVSSREISNCREGSSPQNGWTMSYQQPTDPAAYERLGLAFAVMMTNPGIPLIYYGDEIGLAGGGDPDNRRIMRWNDNELMPAQLELRNRISTLAQIRARYKNLSRGRRMTLSSSQDTWVYQMLGCGGTETVTIMINRADESREADLPAGNYSDQLNEESLSGGRISLAPRSVRILTKVE